LIAADFTFFQCYLYVAHISYLDLSNDGLQNNWNDCSDIS
jgi:hypothetical protein